MNVFYPHDNWDFSTPRGIALGFFDGVHRGHQDLIRTLVYTCEQSGLKPAVFTFPEHPLVTISPEGQFAGYLSTLDQRLQRIADTGVQEVFLHDFSPQFAAMPPQAFLDQILLGQLNARLIVVGRDYRFGHDGEGDLDLLRTFAAAHSIELITMPDVQMHGAKISSSRIRRLITEGQPELAASLLGQPFQMTGTVIEGKKLGRKLGFPTANIEIAPDLAIPAFGVYATRTVIDGRTYESVTNIGIRPTIQDSSPQPNIESFLFDADLDLYGRTMTVEFLHRLRPEATFDSLLDLVNQVQIDLEQTRNYHRSSEQGYCLAVINDNPIRILKTTRFAQATAIVTCRTRINRQDASLFSLLTRVLSASCRRYPSRSGLSAALDSLYGASIETDVSKDGDILSINFAVNALMHWTDHSSPFQDALNLLLDLLDEPDFDADGLFRETVFQSERQGLVMELLARENDKAKYALDQLTGLLCGEQPFGLRAAGDIETLNRLSRDQVTAAYWRLRNDLDCQVAIAGDLAPELLADLVRRVAAFRPTRPIAQTTARTAAQATDLTSGQPVEVEIALVDEQLAAQLYWPQQRLRPAAFTPAVPRQAREEKQVEQARICMAYSGLLPYFSYDSIIDTLMNSMLGGDVHSLLFEVVREQMGLAYSVYSVNSRYLSTLLVIAGVSPDRVDDAYAAIEAQIRLLAEGQFPDSLLERARTLVDSQLRSIPDDLDSLLSHLMNGVTLGRSLSVQDSLSLLQQVTRDQIQARAARLRLQSSFILTAREEMA